MNLSKKKYRFFGSGESFVAREIGGGGTKTTLAESGVFRLDDGDGNILTITGRCTGYGGWEIALSEFSEPVWEVSMDRYRGEFRIKVEGPATTRLIGPEPLVEAREVAHG